MEEWRAKISHGTGLTLTPRASHSKRQKGQITNAALTPPRSLRRPHQIILSREERENK